MELKRYLEKVMRNLSAYMEAVNNNAGLTSAWKNYWQAQDISVGFGGVPVYNNAIDGVPHICMKVPIGGKTFMACASVKKIFDAMPLDKPRVVINRSFRPYSCTDHQNPFGCKSSYRQRLDADFAGRVGIYTKEMLLNGQNFSPDTVKGNAYCLYFKLWFSPY